MLYYFRYSLKGFVRPITVTTLALILSSDFLFSQNLLENAFPNLTFNNPLYLTNSNDGTNRIFVVEQAGIIKVFSNSQNISNAKVFLDIRDRVTSGGEMGLLGLAFHLNYSSNGYFYVNYTANDPLRTIVSRFSVTSNPDSADKGSEFTILTFNQPFDNHNGGWMGFRPTDSYLYIATGDGGDSGDPQNNAQNLNVLLGKILRINVDGGTPYTIPPSNPFFDSTNSSIKKEIYSWGLRNPWRNSFDPVTDWFWCADVGQNAWEEIDLIANGKNYGWRCYEGNHTYNTSGCNYPEYKFPIWEYGHSPECSVTGGYVYRGVSVPELTGKYIYGDYCSKKIWSLEYNGINPPTNQFLVNAPSLITSFGVDEFSEIYIVLANGKIYKFVSTALCQNMNVNSGWNLLSIPYSNNDMSSSNIFQNTASEVFGYNNGYFVADTLFNGTGYWVKYNDNISFQICGDSINIPINIYSGWNLIGPFSADIPIVSITTIPPNIIVSPFYGYSGGYITSNTLLSGKGYWVKSSSNGEIQFNVMKTGR